MKQDRTIKRSHLLTLLEGMSPTMRGVVEVSREFAAMSADELRLRYVRADELRDIYGRRSVRLPSGHPTRAAVDEVLAALKTYGSTYVGTVGMERAGRIVSVWLTETTDAVLAVMSAEDHRQE